MGRTTVWIDANEIKDMDGNDLEIIDANAQALRTLTLVLGIEEEGEGEGKGEGEVVGEGGWGGEDGERECWHRSVEADDEQKNETVVREWRHGSITVAVRVVRSMALGVYVTSPFPHQVMPTAPVPILSSYVSNNFLVNNNLHR
jgi:hypothetical protein